jgi:tRNA modification GTPase
LTGSGPGAIAVIRVWGACAVETVSTVFRARTGAPLEQSACGRLRLGRIGTGLGDEVVAAVLESELSAVEIQCHGGPAALELVLQALKDAGVTPSDSWQQAGLDLASSEKCSREALEDLACASTVRTAEILLEQARGTFHAEIARLAALVRREPAIAIAGLQTLIDRGAVGLRLLSGWKVVIAGRPNVGKSCLFNALCGFPRAIVDSTPGTTRDLVSFRTAVGGWPVEFVDTAGLRTTDETIEQLGIERARRELAGADLVLLVLDRSEVIKPVDRQLLASLRSALVVANKADLPAAWTEEGAELGLDHVRTVSAERGDGIEALMDSMSVRLVAMPPAQGEAVPFRPAHLEKLAGARDALLASDPGRAVEELESLMGERGDE